MADPGSELEIRSEGQVTLFGSLDPEQVIEKVSSIATMLKDVLMKQNLVTKIVNKKTGKVSMHVRVEGWTLLGTLLGVYPVVVEARELRDEIDDLLGFEARAEARTKTGDIVGAGIARCMKTEARWKFADEYAIQSMAETRAISKALRGPLGFVVTMAGYEATPFEEMGSIEDAPAESQPDTGEKQTEDPDEQPASNAQVKAFRTMYEKVFDKEPAEEVVAALTKKKARDALQEMSAALTKAAEPDVYG